MTETAYPYLPPAPLEDDPAQTHTQVDFAQLRSAFDHKQRYTSQFQQPVSYTDAYPQPGAFGQYLQSTGQGEGGLYAYSNANAAPFVPQHLEAPNNGSFSNPGSPYLGINSPLASDGAFASPNHPSVNLPTPQTQSYNGSAYGVPYDNGGNSPNMYSSGHPSPNPYSPNPYGPFGGLGFAGMNTGGYQGMMPPMMGNGLASPGVGSLSPSFGGMPTFPMLGGQMGSAAPPSVQAGRTVYVGNLPADASVDELLSQVRFGPIDSVKILPEKSCAFISFLDPTTASAFHSDAMMRKIRLHEQDLKIGWGKPSAVPANVIMAVQQSGATRNVYLGNLPDTVTEQTLRDDLSRFGPIDQVKIVRDKNIGFVHFLSIATAIKVVQTLATEPEWAGRRVAWGKDRCAYVPKNQHQQQQHNMAAAARGTLAANFGGYGGYGPAFDAAMSSDPNAQPGNRTVYLGNVHPETTTEEICNTIRGGILQQIRYIPDKHICFVTFVDAQCALAFYQTASFQGIALHNRRLKVGWGKHSGPPSPGITMVVQSGGSRNVYIGNIDDFDVWSEDKLRRDFGEYGEIELVNTLREKQCAFVNFTNIANSIKAIEGIKSHPDYAGLKIAYGKDRAGNPPRTLGFSGHPGQFAGVQSPFETYGAMSPMGSSEAFDPTAVAEYNSDGELRGDGYLPQQRDGEDQ